MIRKTVSQAPIYVRDTLNRAGRMAAAKDFVSAVEMLLPVICKNPEIPMLHEKIREFEVNKLRSQSGGEKSWGKLCGAFKVAVIKIVGSVDPLKAMAMCEKSLAFCVDNPVILLALADLSDSAGAPWGTVSALGTLCKLHPGNQANMRRLAEAMQRNGQGIDALKVHQDIIANTADKKNVDKASLQTAMVLASIEKGNFNDQKSHKANAADAEDAIIQQLLDGTIHDAAQAQLLIDRFSEELRHKDSVDMRRKMADAFMIAEKFDDALREYQTVADKLGVLDPVLDKHIEKAYLAGLKQKIDALKADPQSSENSEAQIAAWEEEIYKYRWEHVSMRADRFPNDMQLQFDLGELQFECGMYDEAVATFTAVAENPQKRRGSLVYLGRCALLRNDGDAAISFLKEAVNDMPRMDKYKREALYYLGNAFEMTGKLDDAVECYHQIQVSMPEYRDVVQHLAAIEVAKQQQGQ